MAKRYQQVAGLREQVVGDETMVFDEQTDQVHVLNATSAFVWNCLAEPMTASAIVEHIRQAFEVGEKDVSSIVADALELLESKALVE